MASGTYHYTEIHHPQPDGFGEELSRVLGHLREEGCEIVSISMSIAKLGPVASDYEHSSRVAQIVAYRPATPGAPPSSQD